MAKQAEVAFNKALARALAKAIGGIAEKMGLSWALEAEQSVPLAREVERGFGEMLSERGAKAKPDIVVKPVGKGLEVIIETEFAPANNVENDTLKRFKQALVLYPEMDAIYVTRAVALCVPESFKEIPESELEDAIRNNEIISAACVFLEERGSHRFPARRQVKVDLNNLARIVIFASLAEGKDKIEELRKYIYELLAEY